MATVRNGTPASRHCAPPALTSAGGLSSRSWPETPAWLQNLRADEWVSSGIAVSYYEFGMLAQARGRLDEAEDWYRKALAIEEELADRVGMAGSYHQLGVIAHLCGRLDEAEDWFCKA